MTREEVIRLLRQFIHQFDGRDVEDAFVEEVLEFAADMLEQDAPGWISVKDRMPESGEKVIARLQSTTFQSYWTTAILAHIGEHEKTTNDYDWRDCECDTVYDEKNDCYWISECWYEENIVDDNPNWIIDGDYNVTHWMPLPCPPEPPKEDDR